MFKFTRGTPTAESNRAKANPERVYSARAVSPVVLEGLEDRRLMSVSPAALLGMRLGGFGGHGEFARAGHGVRGGTVDFSQAPAAVRAGLTSLATAQSLTAPTDSTPVYLGNSNGVETYSVLLSGTGTTTRLTVDVAGNPVTATTNSTTTFGALDNSAVTDRINAIATALGLAAPVDATVVRVTTPASGPAVYSVTLSDANTDTTGTNTGRHRHATTITVDANGNPVGDHRDSSDQPLGRPGRQRHRPALGRARRRVRGARVRARRLRLRRPCPPRAARRAVSRLTCRTLRHATK